MKEDKAVRVREALRDLGAGREKLERGIASAVAELASQFAAEYGIAVGEVSVGFMEVTTHGSAVRRTEVSDSIVTLVGL